MTNLERSTGILNEAMQKSSTFADQFGNIVPYNFTADSFLGINLNNLFKRKGNDNNEQEQTLSHKVSGDQLDSLGLGYKSPQRQTSAGTYIKPKYKKERKAFEETLGGKILGGIAGLLTGGNDESILSTAENPRELPNVIIEAERKRQSDKNAKTIFYIGLALLFVVMLILLIKKSKK